MGDQIGRKTGRSQLDLASKRTPCLILVVMDGECFFI